MKTLDAFVVNFYGELYGEAGGFLASREEGENFSLPKRVAAYL